MVGRGPSFRGGAACGRLQAMTVVAVTGARGRVGSALCSLLAADERIERLIGIDAGEPEMPPAKLDFRVGDIRDPVLAQSIDGADVVVHLATWLDRPVSEDLHFAYVVQGTRNVLAAAEKVGAASFVHLSSAMVYGADAGNEVPLEEQADRRAPPDAPRPYHLLLAEELVAAFARRRPELRMVTLRPATVLGPGVDSPASRLLQAPRIPMVAGYEPPFQFLDADDLVSALHLAVTGRLDGPYNVAAEGWVTAREVAALLGRRPLRVPETPLLSALEAARRAGLTDLGPGLMGYLMHPWVVDGTRLREAGWRAERSHREVLRAAADEYGPWVRMGRLRVRRRDARAAVAGLAIVAAGSAWKAVRQRRSERNR